MPTTRSADGVDLVYRVSGTGPLLVLVHGITECGHVFDPLVDGLAEDHTVVVLDLRGHGDSGDAATYDAASMAGDVAAVVAEVGLGSPLVVGHSMGGLVATVYAGLHPCRAVLNIDQSIALGDFQELVRGAEPMLRSDAFGDVITALFDSMHGALPAGEVRRVGALRRPSQEVVLGVWAPLLDLDAAELDQVVAEMTAGVTVPYLALHGIDPGPDYGPWLTAAIPSAQLEVWADHGHYPHLVDREHFVARLRVLEASLG